MSNENVPYLFVGNIFKLSLWTNFIKSAYIFWTKIETCFHFIYGILTIHYFQIPPNKFFSLRLRCSFSNTAGKRGSVIFLCFAGNYKQEVVTAQLLVVDVCAWFGEEVYLEEENWTIICGVRKCHSVQI